MGNRKNECSHCGGKLRNGICMECGMDNRKCDDMYTGVLNRGQYQTRESAAKEPQAQGQREERQEVLQQPETSPGEKQPLKQQVYPPSGTRTAAGPCASAGPYASLRSNSAARRGNKGRSGLMVFFLGMFILIVILCIVGVSQSHESDSYLETDTQGENYDDFMEEYDPYQYIEDQISPIGDTWEQALPAGLYVVGTDIPEGEYVITGEEGSSCAIRDVNHAVYASYSFGTEEYDTDAAQGQKLFAGTLVSVTGMNPVAFSTQNAQTEDMTEKMANPLTESVEIETGTEVVVGQDFPAGVYDIESTGAEFGLLEMKLDEEKEGLFLDSVLLLETNPTQENPNYFSCYKSMILPEGTKITTDISVRLVPSPEISGEDYMGIYENTTGYEGQE